MCHETEQMPGLGMIRGAGETLAIVLGRGTKLAGPMMRHAQQKTVGRAGIGDRGWIAGLHRSFLVSWRAPAAGQRS